MSDENTPAPDAVEALIARVIEAMAYRSDTLADEIAAMLRQLAEHQLKVCKENERLLNGFIAAEAERDALKARLEEAKGHIGILVWSNVTIDEVKAIRQWLSRTEAPDDRA